MLALMLLLYSSSKLVTAAEQCDTYEFSQPFYLGETCKQIYDWNPQTHNRSGYYWIVNPLRHVYCDMEQRVECGNIGGWTRIASVNITRGDECPTGWSKSSHDGISFCRSSSDNGGCYSVLFTSKGKSYQKVCGMARGYKKGQIDAFSNQEIADGLLISHGNPRQHIWSYVAGYGDANHINYFVSNCPCAANPGRSPSSFVGSNYYCEAGTANEVPDYGTYYLDDPLWDGLDCPTNNTCCDNPNLPWFYRELDMATMDDVEVSICADESFDNEGLLVDQLELYLQ